MSGEHQGDMTSASLPAGGEPDALHLHDFYYYETDGMGYEAQKCDCGLEERWVDHDDGHAGGFPHWCDGSGQWGWRTLEQSTGVNG